MAFTTVLDCAKGVKAIYKNENFDGYELLRGFYDGKNKDIGMKAYSVGLYKHLAGLNTYMLSMRGSAGGLTTKDWMDDDVSIGLGRLPDRTTDALNYTRKIQQAYPGAVIIIVGHSLGGHLAQYCGVQCNLPFVTFNAPPALGVFTGKLPDGTKVDGFKLGLNFRVNYDPVSKISGDHVGPLVTLPLNGQKHAAAHTSQVVINSVVASGLGGHGAMAEISVRNR